MIRRLILILLTFVLLMAAGSMTALFIFRQPTPSRYEAAVAGRPVSLPRDMAAHRTVVTEWWYYTGFLEGEDGQQDGFELVFFKTFLPPQMQIAGVLPLNWISNPLYFAHFALSDPSARQHVYAARASFPDFWAAGAREDRFEVWNGTWRAWSPAECFEGLDPLCLNHARQSLWAADGSNALRLDLVPAQPAVLHGAEGPGVIGMGQAGTSYYYSFPTLEGYGTLTLNGRQQIVRARVWMDHQWGSWTTHGAFAGWDWFSLRLDDGTRVMLFGFRNEDGSLQAESNGTWVAPDGTAQPMAAGEMTIEVLERWTSPETGAEYPVKWRVAVPGRGLDVTVAAAFPEQEMATGLGPVYWEGMVAVSGTARGDGFVEMTGY